MSRPRRLFPAWIPPKETVAEFARYAAQLKPSFESARARFSFVSPASCHLILLFPGGHDDETVEAFADSPGAESGRAGLSDICPVPRGGSAADGNERRLNT